MQIFNSKLTVTSQRNHDSGRGLDGNEWSGAGKYD